MPDLTPSQILFIARQHFDAGRLRDAEDLCHQVLSADPAIPEALHLAGLALSRQGNHEAAAAFLNRAIEVQPRNAAWHADLAGILYRAGRLDDAVASYRRAKHLDASDPAVLPGLARALKESGQTGEGVAAWQEAPGRQPDATDIQIALGEALQAAGQLDESAAACARAIALNGADAVTRIKLGDVLSKGRRFAEAIDAYTRALMLDALRPAAWDRLGLACRDIGDLPLAIRAFGRAAAIDPNLIEAHIHLGNAHTQAGDIEAAVDAYCRAIALMPGDSEVFPAVGDIQDAARFDAVMTRCWERCAAQFGDAAAYFKLGLTVQLRGNIDAAITAYRKALALSPDHIKARNNLGLALRDTGDFAGAVACLRQAADADPAAMTCHSNLVYLMHFAPRHDPAALLGAARDWNERYAEPLKIHHRPHHNTPRPGRRLRVGYVSPNFYEHPVGRFLLQLYDCHDHEQFEIVSYSSVRKADGLTHRLREKSDLWVQSLGMSDPQLADRVRADGIDILIDLTMHMRDHRLLTFARRPAPVQLTYLAYCSTTGLDAIDYRLTDPFLDPPALTDSLYSEESIRLPRTYWCYHPGTASPAVNALPALSTRCITFASFNTFSKITESTRELWVQLLRAVPNSKLLMHALSGRHRQRVTDQCTAAGIDPGRLAFADFQSMGDYFAQYHTVDIALDPFPYPGGTTTCDALWMGVPTVSLVGSAGYTRSGLTILSNAGLPDLATDSPQNYLKAAIELADDLPRLSELRRTMRDQLLASPLMDGPSFARHIEACYRTVWQRWCG